MHELAILIQKDIIPSLQDFDATFFNTVCQRSLQGFFELLDYTSIPVFCKMCNFCKASCDVIFFGSLSFVSAKTFASLYFGSSWIICSEWHVAFACCCLHNFIIWEIEMWPLLANMLWMHAFPVSSLAFSHNSNDCILVLVLVHGSIVMLASSSSSLAKHVA